MATINVTNGVSIPVEVPAATYTSGSFVGTGYGTTLYVDATNPIDATHTLAVTDNGAKIDLFVKGTEAQLTVKLVDSASNPISTPKLVSVRRSNAQGNLFYGTADAIAAGASQVIIEKVPFLASTGILNYITIDVNALSDAGYTLETGQTVTKEVTMTGATQEITYVVKGKASNTHVVTLGDLNAIISNSITSAGDGSLGYLGATGEITINA